MARGLGGPCEATAPFCAAILPGGQNTPRGVGYFVPKYAAAIPFLCLMFDEIW